MTVDQDHMAHMRWEPVPMPGDLDEEPAGGWQWAPAAVPLVSGGGLDCERRKSASATLQPARNHTPEPTSGGFPGRQASARGTNTPGDTELDTPEAGGAASTPGGGRRNARETQGLPKAKGGSYSEKEKTALISAVAEYGAVYSDICRAITEGKIPMEKKDRTQQAVRGVLRSWKVTMLKNDEVLPQGFDAIILERSWQEKVKKAGKNPDRKESDVDEQGRPTNTEWDAEQEPTPQPVAIAQGGALAADQPPSSVPAPTTGAEADQPANTAGVVFGQGGSFDFRSPVDPGEMPGFGQASSLVGRGAGEQQSDAGQRQTDTQRQPTAARRGRPGRSGRQRPRM